MKLLSAPQIPGYVIECVLGDGASARVYRASHTSSQRTVALKVMHSFLVDDEVVHTRFLREGEALARLRHPNIVEVYEVGRLDDGRQFLAMELVTGPTLKSLLATEGPMPPARVLGFLKQIAQALVTVHAAGIVHRDLKLTNVAVVGPKGRETAKLLDFGLVHEAAQEGTRLTKVGVLLGSPAFMSPEQIDAPSATDQRADLYALGIMAYALLTGRVPFKGEKMDVLRAQIVTEVPRLPQLGGLEQVVHQLVHKDLSLRTPSASHLLRQIQALLARPPRPPHAPPPPSSTSSLGLRPVQRRSPRRDRVLLSFAALFFLAATAAVGGRRWLDEREGVVAHGRPVIAGLLSDDAEEACAAALENASIEAPICMPRVDSGASAGTALGGSRVSMVLSATVVRRGTPSLDPPDPPNVADRPSRGGPRLRPAAAPSEDAEIIDPEAKRITARRAVAAERLAAVLATLRQLSRRTDVPVAIEDLENRYLRLREELSAAHAEAAVDALTTAVEVLEADSILRAGLLAGFDDLAPEPRE